MFLLETYQIFCGYKAIWGVRGRLSVCANIIIFIRPWRFSSAVLITKVSGHGLCRVHSGCCFRTYSQRNELFRNWGTHIYSLRKLITTPHNCFIPVYTEIIIANNARVGFFNAPRRPGSSWMSLWVFGGSAGSRRGEFPELFRFMFGPESIIIIF